MLSEEYLQELATDYFADQWAVDKAVTLMKEIEAEVRKQDDELIQQMHDLCHRQQQRYALFVLRFCHLTLISRHPNVAQSARCLSDSF